MLSHSIFRVERREFPRPESLVVSGTVPPARFQEVFEVLHEMMQRDRANTQIRLRCFEGNPDRYSPQISFRSQSVVSETPTSERALRLSDHERRMPSSLVRDFLRKQCWTAITFCGQLRLTFQ